MEIEYRGEQVTHSNRFLYKSFFVHLIYFEVENGNSRCFSVQYTLYEVTSQNHFQL